MNDGVPQRGASHLSDPSAASSPRRASLGAHILGTAAIAIAVFASLIGAAGALAASAPVGLGSAASFSVLAGSTVTNTGPTTMFGDLGLSPGSSVTGAPQVLGETHVDDAVAIAAKNALTTAYNDAASRPSSGSAGTDLAGQTFTPGVRTASSSLLLSSGAVTLNAEGDPNAVFIFQIGTTLTTESNTSVTLIDGAQACNVFWQVGSSATLGTGTRFVGTVMAAATITAGTAATIHGRLLAETGAVNLDTNTITNSNCASSVSGGGGGLETSTPSEAQSAAPGAPVAGGAPTTGPSAPVGSQTTLTKRQREAKRRAAAKRAAARRRHHHVTHSHPVARPEPPPGMAGSPASPA